VPARVRRAADRLARTPTTARLDTKPAEARHQSAKGSSTQDPEVARASGAAPKMRLALRRLPRALRSRALLPRRTNGRPVHGSPTLVRGLDTTREHPGRSSGPEGGAQSPSLRRAARYDYLVRISAAADTKPAIGFVSGIARSARRLQARGRSARRATVDILLPPTARQTVAAGAPPADAELRRRAFTTRTPTRRRAPQGSRLPQAKSAFARSGSSSRVRISDDEWRDLIVRRCPGPSTWDGA